MYRLGDYRTLEKGVGNNVTFTLKDSKWNVMLEFPLRLTTIENLSGRDVGTRRKCSKFSNNATHQVLSAYRSRNLPTNPQRFPEHSSSKIRLEAKGVHSDVGQNSAFAFVRVEGTTSRNRAAEA